MKLWLGLALALLCGCAAAKAQRPAPKDAPLSETGTYGPSRVIYVR